MSTELCAREAHLVSGPAGLWLPLLLFANADLLPQYLSCVGRDPRSDRTRMQILVQSKHVQYVVVQLLYNIVMYTAQRNIPRNRYMYRAICCRDHCYVETIAARLAWERPIVGLSPWRM